MANYKFGKASRAQLDTCHPDLVLIAERALQNSQIDFGVTEGYRSLERQMKLFKEGKSKVDGVEKQSMHNQNPSMAFDFYVSIPGKKDKAYDEKHLMYVIGVLTSTALELYREGKISHVLRSGANWDSDGELVYDQQFLDMPHVELRKP